MRLINKMFRFLNAFIYYIFGVDIYNYRTVKIDVLENGLLDVLFLKNSKKYKVKIAANKEGLLALRNHIDYKKTKELIVDISRVANNNFSFVANIVDSFQGINNIIIIASEAGLPLSTDVFNGVKRNIKIRFKIIVENIHSNIQLLKTINPWLNEINISNVFIFRFRKKDVWNIDEKYYDLKNEGIKGCFIPVSLKQKGEKIFIDNEELDYEEVYNLALFYHKCLNDGFASEGGESQYYQVLYKIFSGDYDLKMIKQADLISQGFSIVPALSDYFDEIKKKIYSRSLRPENARSTVALFNHYYRIKRLFIKKRKPMVFIFGWYGTETVGDKAILGGIVNNYLEKYNSNVEIIIGSLYPYISERTVYELGIDAKVVDTKNSDLLYYSSISDEVVMGGGPLMDLHHLYVPLIGFLMARKFNNKRVVFGCGLGPLKTEKYKNVVKDILHLSDEIMLRDSASVKLAQSWGFTNVTLSGDPAGGYVKSIGSGMTQDVNTENVLACYLRELPNSFFKDKSKKEFDDFKFKFESGLANFIRKQAKDNRVDRIVFYHMHNFVVGDDDRDFSRYFIEKYFQGEPNVEYDSRLSTVETVCNAMLTSKINVCMRFHSVLFAETLGVDYVAVDYTNGGKIKALLTDINKTNLLYSIDKINREF